jgi:8-oxo-dGTP pyrophosphatase MutT (NUDIX family)
MRDLERLGGSRFRIRLPDIDYRTLFSPYRRSEVAMIIVRSPGWVLLQTKFHYPPGIFRLPTGTVHEGELAEDTMRRELYEEANLKPGRVRPLFHLEYDIEGGRTDFFTEAFVIEEPRGDLKPNDKEEKIEAWREAPVHELPSIAQDLRRLEAPWGGWGLFRSVIHDLAAELLASSAGERLGSASEREPAPPPVPEAASRIEAAPVEDPAVPESPRGRSRGRRRGKPRR